MQPPDPFPPAFPCKDPSFFASPLDPVFPPRMDAKTAGNIFHWLLYDKTRILQKDGGSHNLSGSVCGWQDNFSARTGT